MAIAAISKDGAGLCTTCGRYYERYQSDICVCEEFKEVHVDMAITARKNNIFEKIKTWFECSKCKSVDVSISADVASRDYVLCCNKCQHTGNVPYDVVDTLLKKLGMI